MVDSAISFRGLISLVELLSLHIMDTRYSKVLPSSRACPVFVDTGCPMFLLAIHLCLAFSVVISILYDLEIFSNLVERSGNSNSVPAIRSLLSANHRLHRDHLPIDKKNVIVNENRNIQCLLQKCASQSHKSGSIEKTFG